MGPLRRAQALIRRTAMAETFRTIGGVKYRIRLRAYVVAIAVTAVASASATDKISIEPGYPFLLESLHAEHTLDGNTLTLQIPFNVSVRDNDKSYLWTSAPVTRQALVRERMLGPPLPDEGL